MHAWLIAVLVVIGVAVLVLVITLPLVLTSSGMTVAVQNSGTDTFDSQNDADTRTFTVTVTHHGQAVPNAPVRLVRTLTGIVGVFGNMPDYAASNVAVGEPLCLEADVNGVLTYDWNPAGPTSRNTTVERAWTEVLTWTAFHEGTCVAPTGASASAALVMTPDPEVAVPTIWIASANVDVANDRVQIQMRSLGIPSTEQISKVGTGGTIRFYGTGGAGLTATSITLQGTGSTGVVYANFAPGALALVTTLFYTGNNTADTAPMRYDGTVGDHLTNPLGGPLDVPTPLFFPVSLAPPV